MSEQEKQEGQKTVVAFIAGLLIGGLLVWIFGGNPSDVNNDDLTLEDDSVEQVDQKENQTGSAMMEKEDTVVAEDNKPELVTGEGKVSIGNQEAGNIVTLESVTFPLDEGWIAVRSYNDEQLGNILGASRFSKEQGLVPQAIQLLAPTVSGTTYAIVFFTENGDRTFNLANDVQIDGVFATFEAK
ncbi:hypothetical protein KC845_00700 [Candidatus Kaiserbacteria bacterium]|nr:hypothetical protein [Candidatus Kaiserbacteria bacterium]